MYKAQKFAVVVWVRKTDAFKSIQEQLVTIAGAEPAEGMIDFHWGFEVRAEAERLANSLGDISGQPEIVLLRLSSYDGVTEPLTIKDARHVQH
jgi:hypothetical protein